MTPFQSTTGPTARALGLVVLLLAGCTPPGTPTGAPDGDATAWPPIALRAAPPDPIPPGQCWDQAVVPAVIETVTEQTLVSPEIRDAQGQIAAPAVYKSVAHFRLIQERAARWFEVPCPAAATPEFWASVQRALKARGYFPHPLTGVYDAATAEAIRRFQAQRGLDSPVLSMAAARELGLAATPLQDL